MVIVDSDVMIDLLRRQTAARAWLETLGQEQVVVPGFVAMELVQGCRNKSEQAAVEKTLNPFAIGWLDAAGCDQALALFSKYYLSDGLGMIDALIGQLAVSMNLSLCTFNRKHYSVIPNIKLTEPYQK